MEISLKTGIKNYIFWSEKGKVWRTGRYTPSTHSKEYPTRNLYAPKYF